MAARLVVSRGLRHGSIASLPSRSRPLMLTAIRPFAARPGFISGGHCGSRSNGTTASPATTAQVTTAPLADKSALPPTKDWKPKPPGGIEDVIKQPDEIEPEHLVPHAYNSATSAWAPADDASNAPALQPGTVVRLVAWNIHAPGPAPAVRASAAMSYLERTFGETPGHLVLMLQEVRPAALQAILDHDWVRRNFVVSDAQDPPSFVDAATASPSQPYLGHFNLLLASRNLPVSRCFRVPFVSQVSAHAVVADLAFDSGQAGDAGQIIRLCTTLLEPRWYQAGYRAGQLALISSLLKGGKLASEASIVGGIMGGDVNSFLPQESDALWAPDVNLTDAWEGQGWRPPAAVNDKISPPSYGAGHGHTFGYHHKLPPTKRKRFARFLYAGSLETVPAAEAQDVDALSGLGRLGIMLKTEEEVQAWKFDQRRSGVARMIEPKYLSEEFANARERGTPQDYAPRVTPTTTKPFVSKHFAVTIGIRVPLIH